MHRAREREERILGKLPGSDGNDAIRTSCSCRPRRSSSPIWSRRPSCAIHSSWSGWSRGAGCTLRTCCALRARDSCSAIRSRGTVQSIDTGRSIHASLSSGSDCTCWSLRSR